MEEEEVFIEGGFYRWMYIYDHRLIISEFRHVSKILLQQRVGSEGSILIVSFILQAKNQ